MRVSASSSSLIESDRCRSQTHFECGVDRLGVRCEEERSRRLLHSLRMAHSPSSEVGITPTQRSLGEQSQVTKGEDAQLPSFEPLSERDIHRQEHGCQPRPRATVNSHHCVLQHPSRNAGTSHHILESTGKLEADTFLL